jgi:hypothetical protein
VVGNNIENLSEPDLIELSAEAVMTCGSTQLLIYLLMIDDIVSMRAAGGSLKIGGAIHMRDAERGEIFDDTRSVIESKILMQLQTISRTGNTQHHPQLESNY